MKSFGLFVMLFVITWSARAELDTLWSREITLSPSSYTIESAIVLQNREVLAASSRGNGAQVDLWRFGLLGNQLWSGSVTFEGDYCSVFGMEQYADGQIALLAMVWSNGDSLNSFSILRFDENGTVLGEDSYQLQIVSFNSKIGLCATSDNHLLAFGATFNSTGFYSDLLLKFNSNGDTVWTRHVAEETESWGTCVRELDNGDLVLCGTVVGDNFAYDGIVMRTSASGSLIWANRYPSPETAMVLPGAVEFDNTQNIYVGGSEGFWWGFSRPWGVKLEPDGDEVWTLSGLDETFLNITGIRHTPNGGAIVCGSSSSEVGPFIGYVYNVDPNGAGGNVAEMEVFGEDIRGMHNRGSGSVIFGNNSGINEFIGKLYRIGPGYIVSGTVRAQGSNEPLPYVTVEFIETGESTVTDAQGHYLLGVGQSTGTLKVFSACTTPTTQTVDIEEGEELEVNFTVGIPQYENNTSSINLIGTFGMWERDTLTVHNDGNGALSFSCEAIEHTPTYGWLFVAPETGEIAPGSSAEIVVSVLTNPNHPESEFFGEVVIHHNACPDTVDEVGVYILALDSPHRPAPVESFALHPAYPNPFNISTRVSFDLPQALRVSAKLFSIEGREVATLVDDALSAGSHTLLVDGANFATGVYLLRVTAGSFVETQKLVLLK